MLVWRRVDKPREQRSKIERQIDKIEIKIENYLPRCIDFKFCNFRNRQGFFHFDGRLFGDLQSDEKFLIVQQRTFTFIQKSADKPNAVRSCAFLVDSFNPLPPIDAVRKQKNLF